MVVELMKRQPLTKLVRCPVCESSNTYYRSKTKTYVCRKDGTVFKVLRGKSRKVR
ncbi:hypothetical protein LCGC14_0888450 [marine sediment metagenome]|uniref:Uncharacterized protein n=1 Tax=marine sediment metagenome TaxID=412755 RepID=A0A0F9PKM5_9ZZZZ